MRATDIMTTEVVTVQASTPVREAVALLAQRGCTSLPVVDGDGHVVGIVSEVDLIRDRMPRDPRSHMVMPHEAGPDPATAVRDVMTASVLCMPSTVDTADLAGMMLEHNVRAVPIVDDGRLAGIVSRRDLLRSLLRDDSAIAADARGRLADYSGRLDRWDVEVQEGVVTVRGDFDDEQRQIVDLLIRTIPGAVRVHCEERTS